MDGLGWLIQVRRGEYDDVSDEEEYLIDGERRRSKEGSIFRLLDHRLYLTLQPTTPPHHHPPLGPRPSTQNVACSHTDSHTLMRAHACTLTRTHTRTHAARPMAHTHAHRYVIPAFTSPIPAPDPDPNVTTSNFDKYVYRHRQPMAESAETMDLLPFFEKVGAILQLAQNTMAP